MLVNAIDLDRPWNKQVPSHLAGFKENCKVKAEFVQKLEAYSVNSSNYPNGLLVAVYAQKEKPLGKSFRPYIYYMKDDKLYSFAKALQLEGQD